MSLALSFGAIAVGVVALARASELFVDGAATVADRLRVSRIVIGTVIVGFGTSAPEMLASGLAAAQGEAEVGIGNVVGSNIANVTLVLGAAAVTGGSMRVDSRVLRREMPLSVGAVTGFALLVWTGLAWWHGLVLLVALGVALTATLRDGRAPTDELAIDVGELVAGEADRSLGAEVVRTSLGLAATVAGAQLLLWGALEVAQRFDLSGGFVGFTVVALGTSLPELVTAVQAARREEHDLIIGNLLGSNLFNATAVGGLVAFLGGPELVDAGIATHELALMVGVCALSALLLLVRLGRTVGFALLCLYGVALWLVG
jgi:cation:H+ antiporter